MQKLSAGFAGALAGVLFLVACSGGGGGGGSSGSASGRESEPSVAPSRTSEVSGQPQGPTAAQSPGATTSPTGLTPPATATAPAQPTYAHEWFVSTTGQDTAAGSATQPFRTIAKAISMAGPGDRILVRAGSYREDLKITGTVKAGTAQAPILLQGEGKPKILPAGASTVILVNRPGWILDGVEVDVEGKGSVAVGFYGTTAGSALKNSTIHHGSAGAGVATWDGASDVTIEGNTIHDFVKSGADSHGVHVAYTSKNVVVRRNRIYGNSGDSVQCEGPEPYGSYAPADGLLIESNEMSSDFEQAVDIKTCRNVTVRSNVMRDYNTAVVIHYSAANVLFENNLIERVTKGIALGGTHVGPSPSGVVIRGNRIRNVTTAGGGDGAGVAIKIDNATKPLVEHNTIVGAEYAAMHAGGGGDGPTDGLVVRNNVLAGAAPLRLGGSAPGLVSASNLFEANALVNGTAVTSWMSSAGDTTSRVAAAPIVNLDTFAPVSAAIDKALVLVGRTFCGAGPDIGAVETGCGT